MGDKERSMTDYIITGTAMERWDIPTVVTAGEIVRCRDCKHFATDKLGDYCTLFDFEDVKSMGNKFCAWGERRDA